jgi:hypothetical protein
MSEEQKAEERATFASLVEVGEEVIRSLKGTLPDEFWHHRAAAHKEILLALRALIDAAIEKLEEEAQPEVEAEVEEKPPAKRKPRRRKVKVE